MYKINIVLLLLFSIQYFGFLLTVRCVSLRCISGLRFFLHQDTNAIKSYVNYEYCRESLLQSGLCLILCFHNSMLLQFFTNFTQSVLVFGHLIFLCNFFSFNSMLSRCVFISFVRYVFFRFVCCDFRTNNTQ